MVELGGLHIVGTERHESRRIDNQLRGRAGRQGDPGSARFYLSLQDDLMRIFGGPTMQNLMLRLGMEEDVPIESKMISKRIAAAQKAVEAQNFASRKHVLEYDDVMNKQRQAVYGMRRPLLEGQEQKERILDIIERHSGRLHRLRAARESPLQQLGLARPRNRYPDRVRRQNPYRGDCRIWTAARWKRRSASNWSSDTRKRKT